MGKLLYQDNSMQLQWNRRYLKLAAVLSVLLIVTGIWRYTPLKEYADPQALVSIFLTYFTDGRVSPVVATLVFSIAGVIMVPVTALIFATALLFPFWEGLAVSTVGVLASSSLSYLLGKSMGPDTLKSLFGKKFEALIDNIGAEGFMTVLSLRLLPLAPYGVMNMALGNLRIPFLHFAVGTLMGMSPGIIGINYFGRAITRLLEDPSVMSLIILVGAMILIVAIVLTGKKMSKKRPQKT